MSYWTGPDAKKPVRKDWHRVWQQRCRDVSERPFFRARASPQGTAAESPAMRKKREMDERSMARLRALDGDAVPLFNPMRRLA